MIDPWSCSQIRLQIERPTPLPAVWFVPLDWPKGSKIEESLSGMIPMPSSQTETFKSSSFPVIVYGLSGSMAVSGTESEMLAFTWMIPSVWNLQAFERRFSNTY